MTIKVEGIEELKQSLGRYEKLIDNAAADAIRITALSIEGDAVKSIQRGTKSGSVYEYISDGSGTVIERDGKFFMFLNQGSKNRIHQASAPGEAPASDTGRLAGSITSIIKKKFAFVGTPLEYGFFLEYGTRKIRERPWLRPARQKNVKKFQSILIAGLRRAGALL